MNTLVDDLLDYKFRSAAYDYKDSVFRVQVQGVVKNVGAPHQPGESKDWKGSAFAVNWNGEIMFITNNHVVENYKKISLRRRDAEDLDMAVVCRSPGYDVALIKTTEPLTMPVTPLPLGLSDELIPQEEVVCVGFPGVTENLQISKGTISSRELSREKFSYVSFDAVANPGNSGGPILNAKNEVIGILAAGLNVNWFSKSGIQLFLPISESKRALTIASHSAKFTFIPPELDIVYCNADANMSAYLKSPPGLLIVHRYDNTPLGNKLQEKDVIHKIDGIPLNGKGYMKCSLWKHEDLNFMHYLRYCMNDTIKFTVWRDGKYIEFNVNLLPSQFKYKYIKPDIEDLPYSTRGGLIVGPIRKNTHAPQRPRYYEYATSKLYIVRKEAETSFSFDDSVKNGETLTHVNYEPVSTLEEYEEKWNQAIANKDNQPFVCIHMLNGNVSTSRLDDAVDAQIKLEQRLGMNVVRSLKPT